MSETQPIEVAVAEVQSSVAFQRLGRAVVVTAAVALLGAFIPLAAVAAGVLGLLALALGLSCLVRDPGFNRPALGGTLLSSAAVAASVVMALIYG
ncbi:MAG TPA: hypothetical protein VN619_03355 [Lacisediminihabitans sp.]|jgi:hypothetical protein|nr:hypothetical protein [Lacisediminihabitans sp.]HXD60945.1 hypothetical protein [Lacisediminihabitans sp.]